MSGEPATSFCELETVDSDGKTLVASDGSMATIIEVAGSTRLVGKAEYEEIVRRFSKTMTSFMAAPGNSLQVYFARDPLGGGDIVREALKGVRSQANALTMNLKDVIDEQERIVAKYVSGEVVYFVCWTHPGVLSPAEAKTAKAEQELENRVYAGLNFLNAQSPRAMISALRNRHAAYVNSVYSTFKEVGLLAAVLDVHSALRAVRHAVDPHWTPRSWRPTVPGDPIPARFPMRLEETSSVWWPPLPSQVWPRDADVTDESFVQIGDRLHAPMYVEIPGRIEPFEKLIARAIGLDPSMPFAVSFVIRGGGLKKQELKAQIAAVLAVASSVNVEIRDAVDELKALSVNESIVSLQISFNTWSPAGEMNLLRERASRMAQAVIDWSGAQVRKVTGDPVEGFTSASLALTANSIAAEAAAPVGDVVPMFPLTQPASPFDSGSELFTSQNGKLMMVQPGSSLQQTWFNIFLGGPGSGKSVQLNKYHKATILAPDGGTGLIPRIAVIDFGMSSSGLVSLFKGALPTSKRHLVNHYRIRNTVEFAINMFDLPLGLEAPPPEQRAMLIDMLTMIATPPETGVAIESMAALSGLVVDVVYEKFSNSSTGHPKIYNQNEDPVVDKAIASHGIVLPSHATWWDVRDSLFDAGLIREAYLAARFAVPTLADLVEAARDMAVSDLYKPIETLNGEKLPEAFSRFLMAAIRDYPMLSNYTKFDIGESRVTIFDLDQVVKGTGVASDKQAALIMALSFQTLTKDFLLHPTDVDMYPAKYREYQYGRAIACSREIKTITVDEFHKVPIKFADTIRNQFKIIAREGRKWKIAMNLSSQTIGHFDPELAELATAIYIMERPDGTALGTYKDMLKLTETEQYAISDHIHGPRAGGGTFFVRMKLKEGYFNQLLKNPSGPIELWALTSTTEDKALRSLVYSALGDVEGRAALAYSYPAGTAAKDIEARKLNMALRAGTLISGAEDDLYTKVATEVVNKYQKMRADITQKEITEQRLREEREAKRRRE